MAIRFRPEVCTPADHVPISGQRLDQEGRRICFRMRLDQMAEVTREAMKCHIRQRVGPRGCYVIRVQGEHFFTSQTVTLLK